MDKQQIVEAVEKMTVLELNDLVKAIEERFGVSAAMTLIPSAVGGAMGQVADEGTAEEKDSFNVILKETGQQKIQVIKAIREVTGKGLKEAKDLTDAPGSVVKEDVKKEEANEIKKKLEEAGATVELK